MYRRIGSRCKAYCLVRGTLIERGISSISACIQGSAAADSVVRHVCVHNYKIKSVTRVRGYVCNVAP